MSTKPTPPTEIPAKRPRSPLPADLQAAARIDAILKALSLEDAELVLDRAVRMFKKRKEAVAAPPFVPN